MAKYIVHGFITAAPITYGEDKGGLRVDFRTYRPSTEYEAERVVVREHSIEVEIPDGFDCRPGMIANLESKKKAVREEAAKKVREIDDWIGRLLALENTVEA